MKTTRLIKYSLLFLLSATVGKAQMTEAPAYPLITHDPYFSIWSMTDELNSETTKHWTGTEHSLLGYVMVDGETYNFMGQPVPETEVILNAAPEAPYTAKYTNSKPSDDWFKAGFNDSTWKEGKAPFTNRDGFGGTPWKTREIWMRREFNLKDVSQINKLLLRVRHDDDVYVYINGTQVLGLQSANGKLEAFPMADTVARSLKKGKNLIAIHCIDTGGESFLDAGLSNVPKTKGDEKILPAVQNSVEVKATQTLYTFTCGSVDLDLTFTSPLVLDDLDLMSRPVSYVSCKVKSNDGSKHDVKVYLGASSDIAVNQNSQMVAAEQMTEGELGILKAGTVKQPVLKKRGDDLRIDWGYLYAAAPKTEGVTQTITGAEAAFAPFNITSGAAKTKGRSLMLNTVYDLGKVGRKTKETLLLLGYDDIYSIQYFGQNLKPWWNKDGNSSITKELTAAYTDYEAVLKKCKSVNKTIYKDAKKAGGKEYADLCVLAYRQAIAAHKLVESPDGEILFLSKENNSNGSINTVDVTYPSAPLFLAYNPDLLKGMLNGIFYYSASGKWTKPFAAHDLGTYPLANGQTYGGDMPVEESGNMVILAAAIAYMEGNTDYADPYWDLLTLWTQYLKKEGFDPANQLCTDDFAGHFARNANLSVKAIVGIACYGMMADMRGETEVAKEYTELARKMARDWMVLADDGDHYALTFSNSNTWSQKYNLIWDKIMDMDIFPKEVYTKEVAYYLDMQNAFGLPLDNRRTYTKSDWIMWTATLADSDADFETLVSPIHKFARKTQDRVPLSDWHDTVSGRKTGFKARSVVGGYFMKVLAEKMD